MPPQDTAGGVIANPRKLREASIIIVVATFIPEMTINEDRTFGKMCFNKILLFLEPIALAALTKSRSLILNTSPRTTLV
ncbi:hypothetical protein D1872_303960 [compost metagenome]